MSLSLNRRATDVADYLDCRLPLKTAMTPSKLAELTGRVRALVEGDGHGTPHRYVLFFDDY